MMIRCPTQAKQALFLLSMIVLCFMDQTEAVLAEEDASAHGVRRLARPSTAAPVLQALTTKEPTRAPVGNKPSNSTVASTPVARPTNAGNANKPQASSPTSVPEEFSITMVDTPVARPTNGGNGNGNANKPPQAVSSTTSAPAESIVSTPVARPPVGNPNAEKPHASSAPAEFTVESTPTTRSPAASPNSGNGGKPSSGTLQTFGGPTSGGGPSSGTANAPTTGSSIFSNNNGIYQRTENCLRQEFNSNGCSCFKVGECTKKLLSANTCRDIYDSRGTTSSLSSWKAFVNLFLIEQCPNSGSKNAGFVATHPGNGNPFFNSNGVFNTGNNQPVENCLDKAFASNGCSCTKGKDCVNKLINDVSCQNKFAQSPHYSYTFNDWKAYVNAYFKAILCPSASKTGGFIRAVNNGQTTTVAQPTSSIITVSAPVASPTVGNDNGNSGNGGGKPVVVQSTSAPTNGKISTVSTPVASPTRGNGNAAGNGGGKPVVQPTSAPNGKISTVLTPVASPTGGNGNAGGNGGKPVVQPTSAPVVVKVSANKQPQPSAAPVRVNGNGNKPV